MPDDDQQAMNRAREDQREGKAPTTQAGEFIREEMHHIREGKHGARSPQQAIAIGLSKARRSGINVPRKGQSATAQRKSSSRISRRRKPSTKRSHAISGVLHRESRQAASHAALSRQARSAAGRRSKSQRSASARKASRTRSGRGTARRKRGTPAQPMPRSFAPASQPAFPMMG
jgi:hypothetical protein